MIEVISRRVNRQRRVGLPLSLAKRSGIEPRHWVTVYPAETQRWTLLVCPVDAPVDRAAIRDPDRPRRVTAVMQVTVPRPWMDLVELKPDQWVFLTSLGPGQGLSIVPQAKVRSQEVGVDG